MTLRVATNLAALTSHRQLLTNDEQLVRSLRHLSSGLRVMNASDDAAGLAMGQKMLAQITGMSQAQRNVQDGVSLIQTAEGALGNTHSILQRMRTLAVQAVNDTLTASDRANIALEMQQLASEVDRIAYQTDFNSKKLLDGSLATIGMNFQLGANSSQNVNITLATATTFGLMVGGNTGGMAGTSFAGGVAVSMTIISEDLEVGTAGTASATLAQLDVMIGTVSSQRASLGASLNRLQAVISTLGIQAENVTAAHSRLTDLDMASQITQLSRSQILSQSSTAMLAQANMSPKSVLQLLGGT